MRKRKLNNLQGIALGYLLLSLLGAALLMLPAASADGAWTTFSDALFTAVSASCVTGLTVVNTAEHWSFFGQAVLLTLIQVGGLGFFTISLYVSLLLRHRVGLGRRQRMLESINLDRFGGLSALTRRIIAVTLTAELVGGGLLAVRFVPRFGWGRGLWLGLFHAVSAFCNAGFDLLGNSFAEYVGDIYANIILIGLIIAGGLGFLVWDDLARHRLHWRRYSLHSKLVLSTTAALLLGGMAGLYLLERPQGGTLLQALFASATARTAGFHTVEPAHMTEGGRLLTIVLMAVGGSPGSTAGGIKTTTFAVLLLHLAAETRREQSVHVFGRRIDGGAVEKAAFVAGSNLLLAVAGSLILCGGGLPLGDALFECVSAVGTVGMSTGVTGTLTGVSRWTVAFLMFCGRVGSASFAVALLEKRGRPPVGYPTERVLIG